MDLGTSTGLAFSSGINAYLPLLSLVVASNIWPDHFKINPQLAFLSQPWFIIILALLTLADLFADKIPVVDHLWDAIHTVLRPVAGAVVAAAANPHATGGWLPMILALGAGLAAMTHITKATTRIASTATTAGCFNIVLSLGEDILVAISVFVSLVAPSIMIFVVALFVIIFLCLIPRIVRIFKRRRTSIPATVARSNSPGHF